jgi:hypothetical protein
MLRDIRIIQKNFLGGNRIQILLTHRLYFSLCVQMIKSSVLSFISSTEGILDYELH